MQTSVIQPYESAQTFSVLPSPGECGYTKDMQICAANYRQILNHFDQCCCLLLTLITRLFKKLKPLPVSYKMIGNELKLAIIYGVETF